MVSVLILDTLSSSSYIVVDGMTAFSAWLPSIYSVVFRVT